MGVNCNIYKFRKQHLIRKGEEEGVWRRQRMAMVNNIDRGNKKIASLIWVFSVILFYIIFQIILHYSSPYSAPYFSSDVSISNTEQRSRLYNKMAKDLDEHGANFLNHGETSQSLLLSDLFNLNGGLVKPVLKAASPPVRANILYLRPEYSIPISDAVKSIFLPKFDKMIWLQNSTMYHFSMFHASHHISPVPATNVEIEAEAKAVKAVADSLCPLKIVLDRVVLTSTGVLLGCWQVLSGTDPITIRAKLRTALPHAPEKQLYDNAIMHTSFARLLGRPNPGVLGDNKTLELEFFHNLVTQLNNRIHGFQAIVSELWYVEEFDVLALALDGKMKVRKFQLGCSKT